MGLLCLFYYTKLLNIISLTDDASSDSVTIKKIIMNLKKFPMKIKIQHHQKSKFSSNLYVSLYIHYMINNHYDLSTDDASSGCVTKKK